MTVDWERYQKCDVCGALLGKPCLDMTAFAAAEGPFWVEAGEPHSTRKLTAAAARAGGDRG